MKSNRDRNLSPLPVEILSLDHSALYNRRTKDEKQFDHSFASDYEDLSDEVEKPKPPPVKPNNVLVRNIYYLK